jgi:hypothetical protein
MIASLFICWNRSSPSGGIQLRYLHSLISIFLLLAATAAAGSFTAEMDVDTYVDAANASQSFSDSDLLWAASAGGEPAREVYLSFINILGSQGIFNPEQIESATLTLKAAQVDKPGKVTAYFLHGATLSTASWSSKEEYDAGSSSAPVEIKEAGSYSIDVTDIIKKAVETCTEGCPYSIVLVAEDDASVAFSSSRTEGDEPKLVYATTE